MSFVLGVSCYYHDAAAALVRNGQVIAAAQEERFTRRKNESRFPQSAISYCLAEGFIDPSEIDCVAFYENPALSLDRNIKSALSIAPAGRDRFVAAGRELLGAKSRFRADVTNALGMLPEIVMVQHHLSHAASCFFPSPFKEAAILTLDGVGEWATSVRGIGLGATITLLQEMRYPHSLGLLYSAFTQYCGFKVNSGEYKLMGLAPYGTPIYVDRIKDNLVNIYEDGSFRLNTDAFGFLDAQSMTNATFEALFGGPGRVAETRISRKDIDLAASIQKVTEEIVLKSIADLIKTTGQKSLVMAGGVALNCVANGRVLRESGLDGLYVQPAAGDAGGALGAALMVAHARYGAKRHPQGPQDMMQGGQLGPRFSSRQVGAFLSRENAVSHRILDEDERAVVIARALADGKVVGFFNGRMEFGPRALGCRSIIGDPRRPEMQRTMNIKIKQRESFRPFAPAVLTEHAQTYFDLDAESPYMLMTAPVQNSRRQADGSDDDTEDLLSIVNRQRSDIPAVTHVDFSARVQTVDPDANPAFRRLIAAFHELSGCPVVINTSFNVRGEPIVCSPQDAYNCFLQTEIDLLVMEDFMLWKSEQPQKEGTENERQPRQFALD